MTYYKIINCGDYSYPFEVTESVIIENGKYYIPVIDPEDGAFLDKQEVYASKKEAYDAILNDLQEYIDHFIRVKGEIYAKSILEN
jgi:hypothetical protein